MRKAAIIFADLQPQREKNKEFMELIEASNTAIQQVFSQRMKGITQKTYIGVGKCQEIKEQLQEDVDCILCNHDLSALQIRNLEDILQRPVMDRSDLILSIFEHRAVSHTAKLQIESAQLKKLLPRLIGANTQLGRQGGSGKNKGVGEKQLELDRRRIHARIQELQKELKHMEAQRATQRRARQKSMLPLVSLIGYTNAGKSTVMNMLLTHSNPYETEKQVLEEDMLFATLDTSIRHIDLPDGKSFLLSDTVGFVSDLPHELIEAFHSTLEEVRYASLLIQVVDASRMEYTRQMEVTQKTLQDIGAADLPMITIFNKCDKSEFSYPLIQEHAIYMSAKEAVGIEELLTLIHRHLYPDEKHVKMQIPYAQAAIYSHLAKHGCILKRDDSEVGIHLDARIPDALYQKYQQYVVSLLP